MSVESLQREGRAAYDKRDFAKALEYYNRAVGRGNPSTKLLDSVAATHYRLGALEAALAAAKKTIQTYREDATGYLRAGQVLLKMDKASTALEIYAYGLRTIKHVGVGFEKLKKAHDELQEELAPKKSIDPLTVLPRELAIAVLEYLNFRQRIAISRVSKGWKNFIKSEPTLWSHLDLSAARKKVRTSFISTAINAGRSKITKATLSQLYDFDKVLDALVKHCPLESLTLAKTGFQGQNLVDLLKKATMLKELVCMSGTEVSSKALESILSCRGSALEVLRFAPVEPRSFFDKNLDALRLPLLTTFDFEIAEMYNHWELLQHLVDHSPALQSLRLHANKNVSARYVAPKAPISFHNCTSLTHLDLCMPLLSSKNLTLPRSLCVLKLATTLGSRIGELFFQQGEQQSPHDGLRMQDAPQLQELHLEMAGGPIHHITTQLDADNPTGKEPLSKLKALYIHHSVVDGAADPFDLHGRLSELQELGITDCLSLQDEYIESVLEQGKNLQLLDLRGSAITGVSVKSIVQSGHVKKLVANDCSKIGRDAIDWARKQGLQIEFKTTSYEAGGKKVRY